MTTSPEYQFTDESSFLKIASDEARALWKSRTEGKICGTGGKNLYWVRLTDPEHTRAIVLVNGRVESCWKYQELIYDFYRNGYDVYSFDHRGQGLSDRVTDNRDIGHVEHFSDYVEDLASLVEMFELDKYQKRFLVAHSMGGAVSTRYLQQKGSDIFNAIAVSAPMYGINIAWYLKPLSSFIMKLKAMFHSVPDYATSNREYYSKPFEGNYLSQSEVRYRWFRKLYEDKPELKVGGPSAHWVWQSLLAAKQCRDEADKITIPLLLLQASDDLIVSNHDQSRFFDKLNQSSPLSQMKVIQGARHEIFFEKDKYRNHALSKVFTFFDAI